jgi:Sec-independent protein translocase protein TatA
MAIFGTELLIIGGIIFLIFLFKPRAIADLARSLGEVVSEFRKGRDDSYEAGKKEELLVETAERLGIRTEGKTPNQIREEILAKAGRDER